MSRWVLPWAAAFGFVGAGFGVAAHPGDRDGVQGAVEVAVAAAVEPVPGPLSAAGLQRGDAGEGGEGGFVADPAAVGPADQQLRSDDGADAGFGEQRRAGGVLRLTRRQLGVELGGLAGRNRIRAAMSCSVSTVTRCSTVAASAACSALDLVELIGQGTPAKPARRCSGATTIRLFSSLIALVRLTRTPCRVTMTCRNASRVHGRAGRPAARAQARCGRRGQRRSGRSSRRGPAYRR